MSPRRIALVIVCLALLPLLAACGQTALTEAPLTRDASGDLAALLERSNEFVAGVFTNPVGIHPDATLRADAGARAITGTCTIDGSGNQTDADGDGIPVDATFSIDCGLQDTVTGASLRITGSTRAQDRNDAAPLSGYAVTTEDYTVRTTDADARVYELRLDLDAELTRSGGAYRYDLQVELSGSTPEGSGLIRYGTEATYTPDQAGDPFTAGRLDYGGELRFEHEGNLYRLTATTLEDLHVTESCPSAVDDGSVRYQDSEGNRLTLRYDGCGDVSAEFEGGEG